MRIHRYLTIAAMVAAYAATAISADAPEMRVWRTEGGTEIRAVFKQEVAGRVVLRKENGRRVVCKLANLSDEDREYVSELRAAKLAVKKEFLARSASRQTGSSAQQEKSPAYLGKIERAVLAEINLARTKPAEYAEHVRKFRGTHHGGRQFSLGGNRLLVTKEGLPAVDEAIRFLEKAGPLGPLTPSEGLSLAAQDHVKDIGPKGIVGHDGSDGSKVADRVNRHGRWLRRVGENISFGYAEARGIVTQLIIDDGVPDRGHRKNIFTRQYATAGVAFGPHKSLRNACVIVFAGGFKGR